MRPASTLRSQEQSPDPICAAEPNDVLKYDVVLDQSFAVIAVEEDGRDLSQRAR